MIDRPRVLDLVTRLPDAAARSGPDGVQDWVAGRHVFLRLGPEREGVARIWSADRGLAGAWAARPEAFPVVRAYRFRVVADVDLARIAAREFAELLLDSYAVRCGRHRAAAVDEETLLAAADAPSG